MVDELWLETVKLKLGVWLFVQLAFNGEKVLKYVITAFEWLMNMIKENARTTKTGNSFLIDNYFTKNCFSYLFCVNDPIRKIYKLVSSKRISL